jgi:hypothetical protein
MLSGDPEPCRLLCELLQEVAKLEQSVLDTYLYAACSLKSMPHELADVRVDGSQREVAGNRRRAIRFERVRAWKQSILNVAHEEMLHLHFLQMYDSNFGQEPLFGSTKAG